MLLYIIIVISKLKNCSTPDKSPVSSACFQVS